MRIIIFIALMLLLVSTAGADGYHRYSLSLGTGYSTLLGGAAPWYTIDNDFNLEFYREKAIGKYRLLVMPYTPEK